MDELFDFNSSDSQLCAEYSFVSATYITTLRIEINLTGKCSFILRGSLNMEFFTECGETGWYKIQEVVGEASYAVVGSAVDIFTPGRELQ